MKEQVSILLEQLYTDLGRARAVDILFGKTDFSQEDISKAADVLQSEGLIYDALNLSQKAGLIEKAIEICEKDGRIVKGSELARAYVSEERALDVYVNAGFLVSGACYAKQNAERAKKKGLENKAKEWGEKSRSLYLKAVYDLIKNDKPFDAYGVARAADLIDVETVVVENGKSTTITDDKKLARHLSKYMGQSNKRIVPLTTDKNKSSEMLSSLMENEDVKSGKVIPVVTVVTKGFDLAGVLGISMKQEAEKLNEKERILESSLNSGDKEKSLSILEKSGYVDLAAEFAEANDMLGQAVKLYARAKMFGKVADAAIKLASKSGGDVKNDFTNKLYRLAAKNYEMDGQHILAAGVYENIGMHEKAVANYVKSGLFGDAVKSARKSGIAELLVTAYEMSGQYKRAAKVLEKVGIKDKAKAYLELSKISK